MEYSTPLAGGRASRAVAALIALELIFASRAIGSTYVVYLPLDSAVYAQLGTLDSLGLLDTYLPEIKPIARVEAARLVLEAERNLRERTEPDPDTPLVHSLLASLRGQLDEEIEWLEDDREDDPPALMVRPFERVQTQYLFSRGPRRRMHTPGGDSGIQAEEATPLFPDNDGLPTAPGSNEVVKVQGWAGALKFLALYGEGAMSGPLTRATEGPANSRTGRFNLVRGEAVASIGNFALSFGRGEMAWGIGRFGSLSQGNNAAAFAALRLQNVHPIRLPGLLRYLGPFRLQLFFGQLDARREFARPWIDGQIIAFKPLPYFEFGATHAIMFGGRGNDNYGPGGFLGRATGLSTGDFRAGNTNSRAGVFVRFRFPTLRGLEFYQEFLGEDNLTKEVPKIGRFLPGIAVSFQGGAYLPRVTEDGRTDFRVEWAVLEPNYSTHSDSLYWTNYGYLMGHPMGPNATRVDVQFGRWIANRYKATVGFSYTERAPFFLKRTQIGENKERAGGVTFDLWRIPANTGGAGAMMADFRARAALEVVNNMNFTARTSVRALFLLSIGIHPDWLRFTRR